MALKKLLSILCLSTLLCAPAAWAWGDDDDEEDVSEETVLDEESILAMEEAEAEANAQYMKNIRPVFYPPVPYGWKISILHGTVSYTQEPLDSSQDETIIRMRYTRKTANMDAKTYMDHYITSHSCKEKKKQGTGFYTTACLTSNTYAIVIGEANNMYIVELTGEYNAAARAIIENYIDDIVHGKKVFFNRNIGDLRDRD